MHSINCRRKKYSWKLETKLCINAWDCSYEYMCQKKKKRISYISNKLCIYFTRRTAIPLFCISYVLTSDIISLYCKKHIIRNTWCKKYYWFNFFVHNSTEDAVKTKKKLSCISSRLCTYFRKNTSILLFRICDLFSSDIIPLYCKKHNVRNTTE